MFQAFVHPSHEYPDLFGAASTPLRLKVGFDTQVTIGAYKIDTTDGFDGLDQEQRNCVNEAKAVGLSDIDERLKIVNCSMNVLLKRPFLV